jgi:mono/diheme cytochrome c family protein
MFKSFVLIFALLLFALVYLPMAGHNPRAASLAADPGHAPTAQQRKNPAKSAAQDKTQTNDAETQAKPSLARAKVLFTRDCALCHGDTGNGKNTLGMTIEDWTDPKTLASKTDSELFDAIRKGKEDKMPPEDSSRASDAEVRELITYIRTLYKNAPPAPAAAPATTPATAPETAPETAPAPSTN